MREGLTKEIFAKKEGSTAFSFLWSQLYQEKPNTEKSKSEKIEKLSFKFKWKSTPQDERKSGRNDYFAFAFGLFYLYQYWIPSYKKIPFF